MWMMAAISFAESSFLPLPPDFLLIPMTLAQLRPVWFIDTVVVGEHCHDRTRGPPKIARNLTYPG
jgi:membrane protein YqaA with SNARE-associated domain